MIQLRIRTEYSFGMTYATIPRIIECLKSQNCTLAGIVDYASTWGHVVWHKACVEAGIMPLLGVELIVADFEEQTRMWFLARTGAGLKELYHYTTLAHTQKIQLKYGSSPRLYREDVAAMSHDIIKFSGDIVDADFLRSIGAILDFSPASRVLNLAKQQITDLLCVTTSDNYYVLPEDRDTFELLCERGLKPTPQHILPDVSGAAIADRFEPIELYKAPMIKAKGNLKDLCQQGIEKRKINWQDKYEQRLITELNIIYEKEFDSYFLIVADMVAYAKQHMLVGPSRGSAAGSLVCYLAGITEIDPLQAGLMFERFIDITRMDLPDIDLDFQDDKREMVFTYMRNKWGAENVSQIGTISRLKPRSALIHVAKRSGVPHAALNDVKNSMITRSSGDSRASFCLQDTFCDTPAGIWLKKNYPVMEHAAHIEGHASHSGVHAAGLLVCNEPIENFATVDEHNICQLDKKSIEELGLLKIDVLGLKTLTVLNETAPGNDWYGLPLNDLKTFNIFNQRRLCGIFQFEGQSMRSVSNCTRFNTIREIDATTALARPGPFGGGVTQEYLERAAGKHYEPLHPSVAIHMSETYGLPIYQEQTLAIVREVGKFSWKETAMIRKAISKSLGKEFFDRYWSMFSAGAKQCGLDDKEAKHIWLLINGMGAWQMNKAHTYSYAVVSYWTAWAKANRPLEYAAAFLRHETDETVAKSYLREIGKDGTNYISFDPMLSEATWSVQDGKLVGGFMNLHGIGEAKAAKLIAKRAAGKLTQSDIDVLLKLPNVFDDSASFQNQHASIYSDPDSIGVNGRINCIDELVEGIAEGSYVFAGRLKKKNPRDVNEAVNVKKRNGQVLDGPTSVLDFVLDDDTGQIICRINRFDYEEMGKPIQDNVALGAPMLVRADFINGWRFAFVKKVRLL